MNPAPTAIKLEGTKVVWYFDSLEVAQEVYQSAVECTYLALGVWLGEGSGPKPVEGDGA